MMRRRLASACVTLGLVAACNVPLERYHRPDGPAAADAAVDAAPDLLAQRAYIKASNTGEGDAFGASVALSADGSTLAVGASREASASRGVGADQDDNTAPDAGAVYVFTRSGMAWSQQAYVKAANADGNDFFGISVALSADGSTLAVGAYSEDSDGGSPDDNSAFAAGAAYVFVRSGAVWSQQAYIKTSNTDAGDSFGKSVALSADGSTLAVGAYGEDGGSTGVGGSQGDNSVGDAGAAYVFTRSGTAWSQQAYLKAAVVAAFDEFGTSVALSADGSTLAVGASREGALGANVGAVEVFTRSGALWSQQTRLTRTLAGGAFGNSVSLSADGATLAVGASREASVGAPGGAVYVLTRNGTAWTQQGVVTASNADDLDEFGASVALSADGSLLLASAPGEDSEATGVGGDPSGAAASASGAAYLFARGGAWTQRAYLKASNTGAGDAFGVNVALSADGATLAAGASSEDSAAKGVGGDQTDDTAANAGAVYVFR